jgi:hypothetical protein
VKPVCRSQMFAFYVTKTNARQRPYSLRTLAR